VLQRTPESLEWNASSGADFAALREPRNAVGGAESERFNGHGGLAASGSHQAAAIAKEKVFDVMGAVVRMITDVFGSFPIRQVPRRCTANCCSLAGKLHDFCALAAAKSS